MIVNAIDLMAVFVIMAWSIWCVLSPQIDDGVVGKVIFSCLALASFSVFISVVYGRVPSHVAGTTMHVCIAVSCVRHFMLKRYREWRHASE